MASLSSSPFISSAFMKVSIMKSLTFSLFCNPMTFSNRVVDQIKNIRSGDRFSMKALIPTVSQFSFNPWFCVNVHSRDDASKLREFEV